MRHNDNGVVTVGLILEIYFFVKKMIYHNLPL